MLTWRPVDGSAGEARDMGNARMIKRVVNVCRISPRPTAVGIGLICPKEVAS
jgi:hypothetical protein